LLSATKKDAKTSLKQHQSQAIKDSFIVEDKDKDNIVNTSKTKTVIETSAIKDRIKRYQKTSNITQSIPTQRQLLCIRRRDIKDKDKDKAT
jgi:Ca2+-binding EF-hand superfamily protein